MINTKITLQSGDADRALVRLQKDTPPKNLPQLVGVVAVRDIQRSMREQRRPDGTPYRPLSRYGEPAKRLEDTHRLLTSITFISGNRKVTVGTNLLYAPTQHYPETVINAKPGKALAIPVSREVARNVAGKGFRAAYPDAFILRLGGKFGGEAKSFLVRRLDAGQRGPRGNTFHASAASGRVTFHLSGGRGTARLQFLAKLVRRVVIHGEMFLGISKRGESEIEKIAAVEVQRVIGGGQP